MRLFIALTLPPVWKDQMHTATSYLRSNSISCIATPRESFHLTLCFLGEDKPLEDIIAAMDRVEYDVFTVRSAAPGCSTRAEGEAWWLGVEHNEALMDFQSQLVTSLKESGLELADNTYTPQLTMARQVELAPSFDPARLSALLPPMEFEVTYMTLLRSESLSQRMLYTPLHRTPLK